MIKNMPYYYLILLIITIPNLALFNYIMSFFAAWKQALLIPTFFFFLSLLNRKKSDKKFTIIMIVSAVFYAVYSFYTLTPHWFFYRLLALTLFFYLFFHVKTIESSNSLKLTSLVKATSIYVSIGVILDYSTNWFSFMKDYSELDDLYGSISRPYFFSGSSSVLYPILSSYLVVAFAIEKKKKLSVDIVLSIFLILTAIFFSGSRSALIMMVILLIYILSNMLMEFKIRNITSILIVSLFVYITFSTYLSSSNIDISLYIDRVNNVFDTEDTGNRQRYNHWDWFTTSAPTTIIGYGIGYLASPDNIFPSRHFESTFISFFIETGIIGTLILFLYFNIYLIVRTPSLLVKLWLLLIFIFSFVFPAQYNYTYMLYIGIIVALDIKFNSKIRTKS